MIKKICDPVQCNRGLAASCRSLDYHDFITCVSNDCILLFLDCADNVLELNLSLTSKLRTKDLIIDFDIALKLIEHLTIADLVLPFGCDLSFKYTGGCFINCRSFVIIIKKSADRCSPVIDQRAASCCLGKISDSYIKKFRLLISVILKIHSSKKRRIHHFPESFTQKKLLFICIHLTEQCLLVIIIFITILVHLCIVFPVIFMHILDFFLSFKDCRIGLGKTFLQTFHHILQVLSATFYTAVHHNTSLSCQT